MGKDDEISLPLLERAVDRVIFCDRSGVPEVQWGGETMVLLPLNQAVALALAGSALLTMAALIPGKVKLSE